ncbi:hypothetical protein [Citrobacter sp. NCU1]|uniref:hypothetical protein n=1 Tax=Citrobacter sp. NCU1 TaxID=2026683 RepID=UPI001391EDC3|nr:hypothetical protein [Citrobacter sp. NCU1]
MKNDELQDEITHLKANYWCTTGLCGLFLSVLLYALKNDESTVFTLCITLCFGVNAYFSMLLLTRLQKLKKK